MRDLFFCAAFLVSTFGFVTASLSVEISADSLVLKLDEQVRVTGMRVGGAELKVMPGPLVSLCDVENRQFVPARVTGGTLAQGLTLDFGQARAKATLSIASRGGALRFTCDLQGDNLPARGMLLRFVFPFDATGWTWHQDIQTTKTISAENLYENTVPLRAYADLPEWRDKPALRMGYSNRNFCTVLTGPVGLCLAVPLDKPCIHRTAYDGTNKRLEIVYDFALSPDTRRPNHVNFAFDLYACDPQWGLRSALAQYYRMYPDFFKVYVREQGQWMAFSRLSEIDNANEFYFALQEGAPEPEYDDKIGVLTTIYFTHAGMFANIPNYDPEKQPMPPYETQVAAMEAQFKRTTGLDGMYEKVGLRNADGKLDVRKATVYGHLIAQFNLDPELPYGEWTLKRTATVTQSIKEKTGGDLDGFYYDGLSTGINYNTVHFKTADAPCLWDPIAKKPFLNNFFSSCEFARAAAELLRPKGQITMMNGALGESFYVTPWLDVLGSETGLRISRENFNYIRTVISHKPFLTLLKGNYEQKIGRPEMELFMKRCLAYGVYPGFFDWPPSGLGPGGQYWNHPRYYERDRDLFRKYQPLCRALALAGWEPVTYARCSEPNIFVERFGPTPEGVTWFTVLNEDERPHKATLTIYAKALGIDPKTVQAIDVAAGTPIEMKIEEDTLSSEIEVPADGVLAIQLATPEAASRWRIAQALETLDRGILMRQVDADKPPIAVHWRPSGKTYGREMYDGKTALVFAADGKNEMSCRQWAMLFQPNPAEVRLRVRARAENLVSNNTARIRCRIAWVTPSFSHYENFFFNLPDGTYDWKDFEFSIKAEHALRAIEVSPMLGKVAKGTLKLAKVSLSDANRDEYVVDPEFNDWYEPIPAHMRERIENEVAALRAALVKMKGREEALDASAQCDALRRYIIAEKAENGCRRVLRDLETIQQHLKWVMLYALDIAPPTIKGPMTAAPGDTVTLDFSPSRVADMQTRTELRVSGAEVHGNVVTIPQGAAIGSTVDVVGLLHIGSPGREAVVSTSHKITIMPPLEMTLRNEGIDQATGNVRVRICLRNNRRQAVSAVLSITAPAGWQVTAPATLEVPPMNEAVAEAQLTPGVSASAGPVEVVVRAHCDAPLPADVSARLVILFIPKEANLLKNPGFEEGQAHWQLFGTGGALDETVARSGRASLKLHNPANAATQASQTVLLNQKTPCAILVRASSRARDVSGAPDKGYSLYVDIYYTDGTPLYGITHDFQTGTTDWQHGELYIEPTKPIRNVNVYLLLRGKSGTVWFDDVAVMEDPRRKGNMAREATISVDSNFRDYTPAPINDGIIVGEGLHWTQEAWASAEEDKDHYIEMKFSQQRKVGRIVIYWSLDAGIARTSQEILVQVPEGDRWKTVAKGNPPAPVPQTEIILSPSLTTDRLRLLQPAGKGPQGRQNLMWVREVEIFQD